MQAVRGVFTRQRHSMPVATATVAWNLRGMTKIVNHTCLCGDCTAPVAPCNDVGGGALRPLGALCEHREMRTMIFCFDLRSMILL